MQPFQINFQSVPPIAPVAPIAPIASRAIVPREKRVPRSKNSLVNRNSIKSKDHEKKKELSNQDSKVDKTFDVTPKATSYYYSKESKKRKGHTVKKLRSVSAGQSFSCSAKSSTSSGTVSPGVVKFEASSSFGEHHSSKHHKKKS